jgi:predicted kinase
VVIALMGLPGAGKSTIARHLLSALPLHEVSRDAIRAAQFPRCEFTDEEKHAANAAVLAAVAANCRLARASLVDGMTFARADELAALRACVSVEGFALLPLHVDCPLQVAQARIAAQARSGAHVAGDRTPALAASVAARFDPPPPDALRVRADQPEQAMCAEALAVVRAALEPAR